MKRVTTAYLDSFNYPQKCISCGQLSGSRNFSISDSRKSGRYSHTHLHLEFPLCDQCADIQEHYSKRLDPLKKINSYSLFFFIVLFGMLYNFANKQPYTITLAIALVVLLAAAFIVTTVLISKIMNEDKDKAAAN